MFKRSKSVTWISVAVWPLNVVLFFAARSAERESEQCFLLLGLTGITAVLGITTMIRAFILKDRENAAEFKAIFGIDPSGIYFRESAGNPDTEAAEDVQKLVDRILREKAKTFQAARLEQEEHFATGSGTDPNDAANSERLHVGVQTAKRAFWAASDAAKRCKFSVKEKYTEWLEPAAPAGN